MKPLLLLLSALLLTGWKPQTARGQASAATPLVLGETFTLTSRALNETRRLNVYLPADYADSTARRYPLVVMPDGGMAEDFLHVAGLLQVGAANGTTRPHILVGIENTERRRDLTGPTTNADDRKIAARVGGSAAFRAFIAQELLPALAARYRTTAEKTLVGESLAGLFVLETFFLTPDLFDTYVAIDPSLWWNNGQLLQPAAAWLRAHPGLRSQVVVAASSEPEIARDARP